MVLFTMLAQPVSLQNMLDDAPGELLMPAGPWEPARHPAWSSKHFGPCSNCQQSPWLLCALHDLTLCCLPAVTPSKRGPLSSLWRDVKVMMSQPIFVLNLLAYCPVQGAFGAYTYWGPQVGCCSLGLPPCTQHLRVGRTSGASAALLADKPAAGPGC